MFGIRTIISLLREINARIAHMALDTSKIKNIVGVLAGNIQTLVSIARKNVTDPADQAAVDAIEQSLEGLNDLVSKADSDLQTQAPAPQPTPEAPPPTDPAPAQGSTAPAA